MRLQNRLFATKQQRLDRLAARPLVSLTSRWVRHALALEIIDRSMSLAAQLVASLIPLLIVIAAGLPFQRNASYWNAVARWLGLRGASRETLHQLIGRGGHFTTDTTWFGIVVLVISAFSFTRALERTYERAWGLEPLGFKNSPRQTIWLAALVAFLFIGYLLRLLALQFLLLSPLFVVVYIVVGVALWVATPYLLLGGRVPWRQLVPGAIVSWAALVVFFAVSALYMPSRIAASSNQFGPIGLIFVILSWYFILFCLVVAGAALGPVLQEKDMAGSRFVGEGSLPQLPSSHVPSRDGSSNPQNTAQSSWHS